VVNQGLFSDNCAPRSTNGVALGDEDVVAAEREPYGVDSSAEVGRELCHFGARQALRGSLQAPRKKRVRLATQRRLVAAAALVDVAAIGAAVWPLVFIAAARFVVAFVAALVVLVSWLPMAILLVVKGKKRVRERLLEALRMLGGWLVALGAIAVVPLDVVFLAVRLNCSRGLAVSCAAAIVALNAVTYVRLLIASGSADYPYDD
jgi:hypothetical protein